MDDKNIKDIDNSNIADTKEMESFEKPSVENIQNQGMHRVQKPKKKKKGVGILVRAIIIILISVLLSLAVIFGFKDIYGLDSGASDAIKTIYIEKGSTTSQIAKELHSKDIVDYPLLFRLFCKLGKTQGFQYGYHDFSENMSYAEITRELKRLAKKKDVVEITVIEGWNFYDVARELKEKGVIDDINAFSKAVERIAPKYDYLKNVPDNKYRYYKYEGYFYPDKYEFYKGSNDYEGIANKFFDNFDKHIDSEIKEAVKKSKYSFDEIITIASLIQAEAGNVNEMGTVSAVFNNRLNSTLFPNLQSDVTINYVENAIKPTIAAKNQELYDAYNTYKRKGLMPGAICNPTKEAIRAALFPENVNYYYFVTDKTGKYYYAVSFKRHQQNCAVAARVNSRIEEGN